MTDHYVLVSKGDNHLLLSDYTLYRIGYTEGNTCHRCVFSEEKKKRDWYKDCWTAVFNARISSRKKKGKECPINYLFRDQIAIRYNLNAFIPLPEESSVINLEGLRKKGRSKNMDDTEPSLFVRLWLKRKVGDLSSTDLRLVKLTDIASDF